jgi:hypothetical protein
MRGLQAFVGAGWAEKAAALGWTRDELFAAPPLWSRIDLCGAALLIGDREVVGITADEIRIKTASGSTQAFYRRPAADYVLMFDSRFNQLVSSVGSVEARLRAREWVIREYQRLHGVGLEDAKRAIDDIIVAKGS